MSTSLLKLLEKEKVTGDEFLDALRTNIDESAGIQRDVVLRILQRSTISEGQIYAACVILQEGKRNNFPYRFPDDMPVHPSSMTITDLICVAAPPRMEHAGSYTAYKEYAEIEGELRDILREVFSKPINGPSSMVAPVRLKDKK